MTPKISFLNPQDAFNLNKLMEADVFVMDAQQCFFLRACIREIRSHSQRRIALAPVFLYNAKEIHDPFIRNLTDGIIFSVNKLETLYDKSKQIHDRIKHLSLSTPLSFNEQILKRTTDYMYTRNAETISPHIDPTSALGYTWPEMSVHFGQGEEPKVLEALDFAATNGFFSESFVDKIHLCNCCGSALLHLHEVCPSCNSRDVEMEDLVHHFPCAYVGPFSDFVRGDADDLNCPKCSKKLRHIGVDHDKPSVICHCNSCNKNFQDAFAVVTCLYCKKQTEMEYLAARNIFIYTITQKGKAAAISEAYNTTNHVVERISSFEVYQTFLSDRLDKVKNELKTNSTLVLIRLHGMEGVYNRIGRSNQEQVVSEITGIIRTYVRSTDMIAVENTVAIHICLNDYENGEVTMLLEKLLPGLSELLKANFSKPDISLTGNHIKLSPEADIKKTLLELNDNGYAIYS